MRLALATIVASLAWVGCSMADPTRPDSIELGKTFSVSVGESVRVARSDLRVGFDDVSSDSRCPKGERCVWAGDAIVRVWLQRGPGPKEMLELHTSARAAQAAAVLGHEVALVRLDPDPIAGKAVTKSDYQATLLVNRGAAAEAR